MSTIGDVISRERKRQKMTMRELGKLSETSAATVCRIEKGLREPKIETARKIFKALGIKELPIMEKHEEPNSEIIDPHGLVPSLEFAIKVIDCDDPYSIGIKNGMIYALSLITGRTPIFDESLKGD